MEVTILVSNSFKLTLDQALLGFIPQTGHRTALRHLKLKYVFVSKHTTRSRVLDQDAWATLTYSSRKSVLNTGIGGHTRGEDGFLGPFMLKTREMAYPALTRDLSQRSPDTAVLFTHFRCTHPPPLAPPFLLTWNLSLKDITRYDIMKLKFLRHITLTSNNGNPCTTIDNGTT